jgi:formate hydrogenlyase subunit 4
VGIATTATAAAVALAVATWAGKVVVFAVVITLVETTNAKLRLFRVPELVAVSLGLGFIALAIRFL